MILRPGYITRQKLEEVLCEVEEDSTILQEDSGQAPKAPGMKYRHYAPKGELTVVKGAEADVVQYINEQCRMHRAENKKTGVISTDETEPLYHVDVCRSVGGREDEETIARELYRVLREFDDDEVEIIYAEAFKDSGIGQAIMNRLLKAAGHRIVSV